MRIRGRSSAALVVVALLVAACVADIPAPAATSTGVGGPAAAGRAVPLPAATTSPRTGPAAATASSRPPVTIPPPCPDLAGPVRLANLIATGPDALVGCAHEQGTTTIVLDAYFPAVDCGACGAEGPVGIRPGWLTGTYVAVDPDAGGLAAYGGRDGWDGLRVTTGPEPAGLTGEEADAWDAAHGITLRVPPALGSCTTMSTRPDVCTYGRYAGRMLRFSTHLLDPAARSCTWEGPEGVPTPPAADVRAYCERQLVVDSVAEVATPEIALPPQTSTE